MLGLDKYSLQGDIDFGVRNIFLKDQPDKTDIEALRRAITEAVASAIVKNNEAITEQLKEAGCIQ